MEQPAKSYHHNNPHPFFKSSWNLKSNVFSDQFQKQYVQDYSVLEDEEGYEEIFTGFMPANLQNSSLATLESSKENSVSTE